MIQIPQILFQDMIQPKPTSIEGFKLRTLEHAKQKPDSNSNNTT